MGCTQSHNGPKATEDEKKGNNAIDNKMAQDIESDQSISKLLLLGAGESGKSTLFKQVMKIYGNGFPEADRKTFISVVYNNVISCMKVLTRQIDKFHETDSSFKVAEKNEASKKLLDELKGTEMVDEALANHIHALWNDPMIKETYQLRAKFQLIDSASHFFERVLDIGKPDYMPTEKDIFNSRVRTTGIVEYEFSINNRLFRLFDVGGQRNERKKWIHCFENVTAVIFVAAISEYDQTLFEDQTTNRLEESLKLFDEICNSPYFTKTSMILFLNKCDLFGEKIKRVPLTVCFSDYPGPQEYDPAVEYLQKLFLNKNQQDKKKIYAHVTCATDTTNINRVFDAITDIIIRKSLEDGGL